MENVWYNGNHNPETLDKLRIEYGLKKQLAPNPGLQYQLPLHFVISARIRPCEHFKTEIDYDNNHNF
jgi:hypothetical protein